MQSHAVSIDRIQSKDRNMNASTTNASIVYLYQGELRHGKGFHPKTVNDILRHIWQFEEHTGSVDFRAVTLRMIEEFKEELIGPVDKIGKEGLSASTIVHTFGNLKAFFSWLSNQEGYRRSITRQLCNHFNPSRHLVELAGAAAQKYVPSADQLRSILETMPVDAPAQRRNRAMLAALFLFGVRDGALISLRLKHVDIDRKQVFQDAREVKTKFSKTSFVDWFPVGDDVESIVIEWIAELRNMGAGDDAPLFPTAPFKPWVGRQSIELEFLTTAAPVRQVLRRAAAAAGVPYFKPHAVRSTVAKLCDEWAVSLRDMKALSQNLGHEQISTTSKYYGDVDPDVKQELFRKMREKQRNPTARDIGELAERASLKTQNVVRTILLMELDGN
ncbi:MULTISPECIES: tyrosine-type recombinase/integrase [unclassified Rhizobium]|uniref:tyrosine-type recombinase/integrase n=1 Tax=unclassified Rhizobium TaxID=2613769 RepID=UPI001786F7FB|nr:MULTISPECIES: tyrosine-type recombinase/integrase [unclassified Rhizobium]MBD8689364.1 tyrosine-type recombinase/integrase [Rhizobium sp. CFBP 13644]MBD8693877.1 tyrosine-type recombinase/integrase [Rhizobium sp. CFBP 13717]